MKIYYIHGYNSSVNSDTFKMLQKEYKDATPLTYDMNDPVPSIEKMKQIIMDENHDGNLRPVIVGSSLGGWYAEQLSQRIVGDFIFYNPSTDPSESLAKYGLSQEILQKYSVKCGNRKPNKRVVILSEDDEVIPYSKAKSVYEKAADIKYTKGGHRMTPENLEIILATIKQL